jgi:hypothetical protein
VDRNEIAMEKSRRETSATALPTGQRGLPKRLNEVEDQ